MMTEIVHSILLEVNHTGCTYKKCLSVYVNEGKRRRHDIHPIKAYPREVTFRLEHTSVDGLVVVVEGDHVEDYCLWYSQDNGQDPNGEDLNGSKEGNADPLHSAPGGYSPVPEPQKRNSHEIAHLFHNRDMSLAMFSSKDVHLTYAQKVEYCIKQL